MFPECIELHIYSIIIKVQRLNIMSGAKLQNEMSKYIKSLLHR